MKNWIEVKPEKSTHTEIRNGIHVDIYPNVVASQYVNTGGKRRYIKQERSVS